MLKLQIKQEQISFEKKMLAESQDHGSLFLNK